ncbi:hypothetical protein BBJ28_00011948 [Nothophytophthora sp. Chile5]|nr:hypothetical protein BBJ28_00011948 [Nothophytophthora sp. Chile5]
MDFVASFPVPPEHEQAADVTLDTQLYTMIELEGGRYRAFFGKLSGGDGPGHRLISRDAAMQFFRKSSLSEDVSEHPRNGDIELYDRIKALKLQAEPEQVGETEFVIGMHLIVCMTKRNLVKIPPTFPTYLFPTLDLTPESTASSNGGAGATAFGFASLSVNSTPSETSKVSSDSPFIPPPSTTSEAISFTASMTPAPSGALLQDAKSLSELVTTEVRSKQHEAEVLSRVDQSETRALQSLHGCLERIAEQIDALGFPVPASARSLDAVDDLRNLLQKHVHAAKQEIQSLQIDAQMRSVASEVSETTGSREDSQKIVAGLTQELMVLQQETAQLMAKKDGVVQRLLGLKKGTSASSSSVRSSFAGAMETKNPDFALSKGALTVGELGTDSETTPPKHVATAEPSTLPSHNSSSSGGWGTFGAGTSQDPPPPLPFGAKIENAPAPNDPFGFGGSPAVPTNPSVLPATAATGPPQTDLAATPHVPDSDFTWGSFQ